jgi:hypothetical protein
MIGWRLLDEGLAWQTVDLLQVCNQLLLSVNQSKPFSNVAVKIHHYFE